MFDGYSCHHRFVPYSFKRSPESIVQYLQRSHRRPGAETPQEHRHTDRSSTQTTIEVLFQSKLFFKVDSFSTRNKIINRILPFDTSLDRRSRTNTAILNGKNGSRSFKKQLVKRAAAIRSADVGPLSVEIGLQRYMGLQQFEWKSLEETLARIEHAAFIQGVAGKNDSNKWRSRCLWSFLSGRAIPCWHGEHMVQHTHRRGRLWLFDFGNIYMALLCAKTECCRLFSSCRDHLNFKNLSPYRSEYRDYGVWWRRFRVFVCPQEVRGMTDTQRESDERIVNSGNIRDGLE